MTPGLSAANDTIVDTWRYTLRKPAASWMRVDFDAAAWQEGPGGFGTPGTPGARIGTQWSTNAIWLRKSFELAAVPHKPALLIHHDEDTEVFLNGQSVAKFQGYITEYKLAPLKPEHIAALHAGKNVLAVHCRQTGGGQFIDVHVVDADNPPKLPPPKRNTSPFKSDLITSWGAEVTADNAWTEYPRPQLERGGWTNLNGLWEYAITPIERQQKPEQWQGKILVPYALESKLGGVQRLLDQDEALWYRRTMELQPRADHRTQLNFEAVDYRCAVFVNDRAVGSHQGGHTPFSFDVT
ncbi:MAG: glycoside hydrolase family 2, partial [Planctomycetales bacterium]|nr:glycoside hydrolase family 2 [Planctomycetales bacterium]